MHCLGQQPSSLLLVQGTSIGKSMVPQTVGVVTCGVTLVIENTLSLGVNQSSKFKNAHQDNGLVTAYQLDSIVDKDDVKALTNTLVNLPLDKIHHFFHSLPEKLSNPKWSNLIDQLISQKIEDDVC